MEFDIVVGMFMLGALVVGIYFYDRMYVRLTTQNKELAYKNNQIDMETKAFRTQMNPHFIYNSFSAAQYLIMINENEKAFNYLSDFSLLMRQMFENAKKSHVKLSEEIEFIERYIELEKIRFNNSFTCKIEIIGISDAKNYKIPTMMVQPVVENAIRHGLAPKKQNGELYMSFKLEDEYIVCKIEDNGLGLKKEGFNIFSNENSAMFIIKERLEVINSFHNKKGKLTIINKADTSENTGVIVELYLPFRDNT
ncbi:MAG TPA: histidine kinase [Parafilimonas sp.]|nr:histidine kinase [Parafilimonas sp.]